MGQLFSISVQTENLFAKLKHFRSIATRFEKLARLWSGAESLLQALGAELSEGRGSRLRVSLNGKRAVFHRPHPRKETNKGAVVSLRRFLIEAGINHVEL